MLLILATIFQSHHHYTSLHRGDSGLSHVR